VLALESDDDVLRGLAMRLVARADVSQLEAARQSFEASDERHRAHVVALGALVAAHLVSPETVAAMMLDADPLTRRYGAIAAKRFSQELPHLIEAARSSDDPDLRRFAERMSS
jgi:hypothetical protein